MFSSFSKLFSSTSGSQSTNAELDMEGLDNALTGGDEGSQTITSEQDVELSSIHAEIGEEDQSVKTQSPAETLINRLIQLNEEENELNNQIKEIGEEIRSIRKSRSKTKEKEKRSEYNKEESKLKKEIKHLEKEKKCLTQEKKELEKEIKQAETGKEEFLLENTDTLEDNNAGEYFIQEGHATNDTTNSLEDVTLFNHVLTSGLDRFMGDRNFADDTQPI